LGKGDFPPPANKKVQRNKSTTTLRWGSAKGDKEGVLVGGGKGSAGTIARKVAGVCERVRLQ